MLAPHSPPRPAVTALALAVLVSGPAPAVEAMADDPVEAIKRSPARYLWAMRLARLDEAFPLTCPRGGAEMRLIAFSTEAVDGRAILEPIGEPATPPRIAAARGLPAWYEDAGVASIRTEWIDA